MRFEQKNLPEESDSKNEQKEIEIGLATSEDSRDIYQVKKDSWLATHSASEYGLTKEDIKQKDFFDKVEKLQGRLERGEAKSFVVRAKGKIVDHRTFPSGKQIVNYQMIRLSLEKKNN